MESSVGLSSEIKSSAVDYHFQNGLLKFCQTSSIRVEVIVWDASLITPILSKKSSRTSQEYLTGARKGCILRRRTPTVGESATSLAHAYESAVMRVYIDIITALSYPR